MAYSEFTLDDVATRLGIKLLPSVRLFPNIEPVSASEHLPFSLSEGLPVAEKVSTEKVRSELIVAPIPLEVRRTAMQPVSLFSGCDLTVDRERGLNGVCGFLLTLSAQQYVIETRIMTIVEAKNNHIRVGLGQCIAEMYAAKLFNHRQDTQYNRVHGAVTTGGNWEFVQLDSNLVVIDEDDYHISQLDIFLGIFRSILMEFISIEKV